MESLSFIQALIMGLVQGLTEFLPVSSSAHLVFADHFLHIRMSEAETVSFDVLLHVGTLFAVLLYFRKDVWLLLCGAWQLIRQPRQAWQENANSRLAVLLLVGTIPAGVVGVTLKDFFSNAFQNVPGTALFLLVTAGMLIWITRRRAGDRSMESATWKDALTIGAFQAFAILPGISRSGSTITGGLLRGLDRDAAPRFSFLLSIPIIVAGALFDFKDTLETGFTLPVLQLLVGFVAAAVSGYLAVVLLLGIVRRGRLDRFAYYCIPVGIGVFAYWTLLVPQVDVNKVYGRIDGQESAIYRNGEIGDFELGQQVQLQLTVKPGMVPVREVTVLLPVHQHGQQIEMTPARFTRLQEGSNIFISERYQLRPIGDSLDLHPAGAVREAWVVITNEWGIKNEVRLRLRVKPEPPQIA